MRLKKIDQNYKNLTDQQYADLIMMRQNSFKNLSFKKYLKLKAVFFVNIKHKPMTDQCGEVIGFLFREMLNELVDKIMYVKNNHDIQCKEQDIITSGHVFEAFRKAFNDNFSFVNKSSVSKRYLFFR